MIRLKPVLVCSLLATAAVLFVATFAEAGFRHRHQIDPGCAAVEPGCSAFEPACAIEPSCGFEPTCGCEPGCGAATVCPTNPCIKYHHKHACRHHHCAAGCCGEPTYQTVLTPTSPETCQTVAVPVCLPACCQGCPCEASRCTLLGCGQVRYDYACGCSVVIRFQKCGDILVVYHGF